MAVRFYADFRNDAGDDFRVNIYDNDFSLPATEQTLSVPGFTLTYEGNNQEQYQPIIASRLDFTIYNEGGDFDTWLNTDVPASAEGRYPIELVRDLGELEEVVWWRGILIPEQMQQMDEATPSAVNLTASDDLAQLKETTSNDMTLESATVIGWVHGCLKLTRQSDLYANGDLFIRYANDFKPDGYTGSDYLGGGVMFQPSIPGTVPTEYYTAYEILRSLAITFNARVFQAEGVWYFFPLNKFQQRSESVAFISDLYARNADYTASTWTTLEKVTWTSDMLYTQGTGIHKMRGNTIEYSRPVKRAERVRVTRGGTFLFQFNTDFTTLDSAANDIELTDDDRTYYAGSTHLITLNYNMDIAPVASENNFINFHTVRADLTIKFGSQYYTDTGWSGSAGTKSVVIGTYYKSFGFESIGQVSVQVPELVSDQVGLDVTLNTVVLNGAGGDIVASLPTNSALFILRVFPGDSADTIGDEVVFSSETTLDNQVTLTQDNVITGNTLISYGTGGSAVPWGAGSFGGTDGDLTSWVSSQDTTGYSLHRLGVRDILQNTQLPHRIRQGDFAHGSSGFMFWPYNMILENSDYHVIHEMSYSANDNTTSVERFHLNKATTNISFRTDLVVNNNPRDRFTPSGNTYADTIATNFDDLLTGRTAQFAAVQSVTHSNGSSHTIDIDDDNGYMYMNGYTGANGFGRLYLPKVADNEGRIFRFKTDSTVGANTYYQVAIDTAEAAAGVTIDGSSYAQMDRPYDGIMVLCYSGQWYVIQRKSK
jgi:hypothetical protein